MDKFLKSLSPRELISLRHDWTLWARQNQLPPNESCSEAGWRVWLVLAGRGWGKTRTGAEFIRAKVESGAARRIALVGETWADIRDVMIEGDSGILNCSLPWNRPHFESSKRRLTWPCGAQAFAFSAVEPDQLRGPQFDCAWADEIAKWHKPNAWVNLLFSLRLGDNPQIIATTTPRSLKWLKDLSERHDTVCTFGNTYENALNLPAAFLGEIISRYEGTRVGRQEIHAEFLENVEGALWSRALLEKQTVVKPREAFDRIIVAIDPSVSAKGLGDETGIIVVGKLKDTAYVLGDYSLKQSPLNWANKAVEVYHKYQADRVIVEANQGGDLLNQLLQSVDATLPIKPVYATRGKVVRAEPVAALYEQGRVFHVPGLSRLEDQLCSYNGAGKSPDRLDALVWGITHLMLNSPYKLGMVKTSGW